MDSCIPKEEEEEIPYWTSVKDFDTVPRDSLLHKLENTMALGDHCSTCSGLFSVK
jgi:hypothetical protein